MIDTLLSAVIFLVNTCFNLFIFVLLLRLLLALVQANYFHPLTQFIVKCSNWLIKPTRKVVPNIKQLETACLVWILLLQFANLVIVNSLSLGIPHLLGMVFLSIGETLNSIVQIYMFAIIGQCILSWIQPYSPANALLQQFVSPIMQPIRRLIPTIQGLDISPIPAIIALQLTLILLVEPIRHFAIGIAY